MIGHLKAMQALVEALGFEVWLIDATGSKRWPRVTITPAYGRPGVDRPLSDDRADIDEDIRVTSAGLTAESALGVAGRVREVLSPGHSWLRLDVPGRDASIRFLRHELTNTDRELADPATNRFPTYTVETFRIVSTPID